MTTADVIVAVEEITPSTFESADCTLGGHPRAQVRPFRFRVTVSTLAFVAAATLLAALFIAAVSAHDISAMEDAATAEAIIIGIVFFIINSWLDLINQL